MDRCLSISEEQYHNISLQRLEKQERRTRVHEQRGLRARVYSHVQLPRLQTLQAATVLHFASMAWGIKNSLLEAPAEAVKRLSPPAPTRGDKRQAEMNEERQFVNRVGKHEVTVRAAADEEEVESDLAQLTKEVEEMHPWDLARGTKRAVLGGGGAFNGLLTQCRHDPQLVLPGGAWVLTSLPDIWKGLEAGGISAKP